ncbi:MAG: VCBS domain-containing protein, partial [Campylobacterales bacterium]|nr:VCBS domain-containing protein [Campylobacterales bacterium]
MARIIGYVKAVENGTFFVKDIHGHIRQLKAGDVISEGELVYGDQENIKTAKIIIDMTDAGADDITLAGNNALNFDTSLLKSIFLSDDAVIHTNSLKSALNIVDPALTDEKNNDKETAAGNEVVMSENSTSVVFADRTGMVKDVRTLLDLTAINSDQPQVTIETFRPVVINTPVISGANFGVDAGSVTEDTALTTAGTLTITDTDAGQAAFQAQTSTTGAYGTFT